MDKESQLIRRCQRGDPEAFAELVDAYKKPIYNLAFRMLCDREEANDITQDTFLRVYRNLDKYKPEHKVSTWIYTIASNLCIDRLRKLKGNVQELDFNFPDHRPLPEEQLMQSQMRRDIDEAINQLPEKYRLVIVLRHLNELSYEEIASALAIPVNTVKTHLFRGREMLKQTLLSMKVGECHG